MQPDVVVLYPGAGGDSSHPTLRAIEEGLAPLPVARRDFPYRREGRRAPDRAPKLIGSIVDEAEGHFGAGHSSLVLGGRSMGGRMCSMAVAQGLGATGLILLSYPLHPPGKPEKRRVDHFPEITVPCLFVSGTRDPFGTPDEFNEALETIPAPVRMVWLDGQRHDPKGCDETILGAVRDWIDTV